MRKPFTMSDYDSSSSRCPSPVKRKSLFTRVVPPSTAKKAKSSSAKTVEQPQAVVPTYTAEQLRAYERREEPLKNFLTISRWFSETVKESTSGMMSPYCVIMEPFIKYCCPCCGKANLGAERHWKPKKDKDCSYDCLWRVSLGFWILYLKEESDWKMKVESRHPNPGPKPTLRLIHSTAWKCIIRKYKNLGFDPFLVRVQKVNWLPSDPLLVNREYDMQGNLLPPPSYPSIKDMYDALSDDEKMHIQYEAIPDPGSYTANFERNNMHYAPALVQARKASEDSTSLELEKEIDKQLREWYTNVGANPPEYTLTLDGIKSWMDDADELVTDLIHEN